MKFKSFLLFIFDILFYIVIYVSMAYLLDRPIVPVTGSVLFLIYLMIFWYLRFYSIELYLNKMFYFLKILIGNLTVFVLFWGIWWFLLKTQWPDVSRLHTIVVILVYGFLYFFTIRLFIGNLLLKSIRAYIIQESHKQNIYYQQLVKFMPKVHKIKSISAINKKGFLFLQYKPSKKVKTRADMWGDYIKQIEIIKEKIKGKSVKAFFYNKYNIELKSEFPLVYINNVPLLKVKAGSLKIYRKFVKRFFDILICILLLPFFIIIHPFVYFMLRSKFGKPVIFKQLRAGKYLKKFRLYKYRTMEIVKGEDEGEVDEIHYDYIKTLLQEEKDTLYDRENIIKVEKKIRKLKNRREFDLFRLLLRKTSIDEIPQIINVIKGDMSVVGPRPSIQYECKIYPEWAKKRFNVPQGITGLWQISGRGTMPLHTSLFLDVYYSLEYSIWFDIFILIKTLKSVFNFSKVY